MRYPDSVSLDLDRYQAEQDHLERLTNDNEIGERALELATQNCDDEDFKAHVYDRLIDNEEAVFDLVEKILTLGKDASPNPDFISCIEETARSYFHDQAESEIISERN